MLARLRNATQALKPLIELPHSRIKEDIARILKHEGYVSDVKVAGAKIKKMTITLKYQDRKGIIAGLKRVSTPGRRCYVGCDGIPRVLGGMGTAIVSTPKGVLTGVEARKQNLGGELLCLVW